MADGQHQGRGQCHVGHRLVARTAQQQRDGHRDQDEPDVLRRGVGQQPLEVGGHRGLEDPVQRRGQRQHQQQDRPPRRALRQQPQDHQQQAVHAHLDHRRAHRRRHVAGCLGVCEGQPDMDRDEPGLGGEAAQQQDKGHARRRPGHPGRRDRGEAGATGLGPKDREAGQQQKEARMGHHRVPLGGPHDLGTGPVVSQQQHRGADRHRLPCHQERHHVGSGRDQLHAHNEHRESRPARPRRRCTRCVPDPVQRCHGRHGAGQDHEDPTEPVRGQQQRLHRNAQRQSHRDPQARTSVGDGHRHQAGDCSRDPQRGARRACQQ